MVSDLQVSSQTPGEVGLPSGAAQWGGSGNPGADRAPPLAQEPVGSAGPGHLLPSGRGSGLASRGTLSPRHQLCPGLAAPGSGSIPDPPPHRPTPLLEPQFPTLQNGAIVTLHWPRCESERVLYGKERVDLVLATVRPARCHCKHTADVYSELPEAQDEVRCLLGQGQWLD